MATLSHRTDWLHDARWGVMAHFIAETFEATAGVQFTTELWNEWVEAFDVEALARQLRPLNPGYYLFALTQNSGYMCSPNAAYDRYVGREVSRCSRRDLIVDL